MALNKKELEIIEWGKNNGKNNVEIMKAVANLRERDKNKDIYKAAAQEAESSTLSSRLSSPLSGPSHQEIMEMNKEKSWIASPQEMMQDRFSPRDMAIEGAKGAASERLQLMEEARQQAEDEGGWANALAANKAWQSVVNAPVIAAETTLGAIGGVVMGTGKILLSKKGEEDLKNKFGEVAGQVAANETVQGINSKLEDLRKNDPTSYANVKNFFTAAEVVLDLGTAAMAGRATSGLFSGIRQGIKSKPYKYANDTEVAPFLDEGVNGRSADEVMETAMRRQDEDWTTSGVRQAAEDQGVTLTFREKWIGLRPDQKKRIEGQPDLLKDYINIVKARNEGDFIYDEAGNKYSIPSALGYGNKRVESAYEVMTERLNNSGTSIGRFREVMRTTSVPIDSINAMENSFKFELSRLNLHVKEGKIEVQPGRNPKTQSEGDLRVLQDLWNKMQVVKQSPNLQNYYEYRSILDGNINYAKVKGEGSNSLDRIALSVRQTIETESRDLLGNEYAGSMDSYSRFMDAYKELEGYTNRRAGSEYLLRLLDTGRSREADELIDEISKVTGVDLKTDATMISLVTDMFGTPAQKTAFQQEVQRAGIDIMGAGAGSPLSWLSLAVRAGGRFFADEEDILMAAARNKPAGLAVSDEVKFGLGGSGAAAGVYVLTDEEEAGLATLGLVGASLRPETRKIVSDSLKNAFKQSESMTDFRTRARALPEIDEKVTDDMLDEFYDMQTAGTTVRESSFNEGATPQTTLDPDLPTTKVVNMIVEDGRPMIPKSELTGMMKKPGVKGAESTILKEISNEFEGSKIPAQEFVEKVQSRLLPLKSEVLDGSEGKDTLYYSVSIGESNAEYIDNFPHDYKERIYTSPYKTNVNAHGFNTQVGGNYFSHTRYEDAIEGDLRRIIEMQSDLHQKGRLEQSKPNKNFRSEDEIRAILADLPKIKSLLNKIDEGEDFQNAADEAVEILEKHRMDDSELRSKIFNGERTAKNDFLLKESYWNRMLDEIPQRQAKYDKQLKEYEDLVNNVGAYRNTWWERQVREEIAAAVKDGKKTLQFPTGKTAAKIEGFGGSGDVEAGEYTFFQGREALVVDGSGNTTRYVIPRNNLSDVDVNQIQEEIARYIEDQDALDHAGVDFEEVRNDLAESQDVEVDEIDDDDVWNEIYGANDLEEIKKDMASSEVYDEQSAAHWMEANQLNVSVIEDDVGNWYAYDQDDIEEMYLDFTDEDVMNNPVTKWYETDVRKYLEKNFNAKEVEDSGYTWIEVDLSDKKPNMPVEAFGLLPFATPLLTNEEN